MTYDYWLKVTPSKPPFESVAWETPERMDQRGKLGIIGGTKLGFSGVAAAYKVAVSLGAGTIRAVLPLGLKPALGNSMEGVVYAASNTSGGFAKAAEEHMAALAAWSDMLLLPGDTGRNSETAIAFENILARLLTPVTITRDAVDLLKTNPGVLIEREKTLLVISFAQLQKLLQSVYFPRGIVFSMHLAQLVETLHKVTLSYPATIVTFHQDQLIIASEGRVATMPFATPMLIWRGTVGTQVAVAAMQHPREPFEAIVNAVSSV